MASQMNQCSSGGYGGVSGYGGVDDQEQDCVEDADDEDN